MSRRGQGTQKVKKKTMSKTTIPFDTRRIGPEIDPSESYTLHLKDRPIYDEETVFGEVVKEKTLPFDKDMLEFAFLSVLKTMTHKVSQDCIPRKIGNYVKFLPTIRGKVSGPYAPYDPKTCSTSIVMQSLSGLEKAVDMTNIQFVNVRQGRKATVRRVSWRGSEVSGEIMQGKQIRATGDNVLWLDGDTITVSWEREDGTKATTTITSVVAEDSDVDNLIFEWPHALDGVATGTDVEFAFNLRGGIEQASPNRSTKHVTVVASDTPEPDTPTFTKVTSPGHEDDPEWANKVSRDGKIVVLGTGFTDEVTAEFSTDGNPETFNVTARTSTSITGQIAGGLEAGGTLVMELKDGAGDVIDTASVDVVEG